MAAGAAIGLGALGTASSLFQGQQASKDAKAAAKALAGPQELQDLRANFAQTANQQLLPGIVGGEATKQIQIDDARRQEFIAENPDAAAILAGEKVSPEVEKQIASLESQLTKAQSEVKPNAETFGQNKLREDIKVLEKELATVRATDPISQVNQLIAEDDPNLSFDATTGNITQTTQEEGSLNKLRDLATITNDPRLSGKTEQLAGDDGQLAQQRDDVDAALLQQAKDLGIVSDAEVQQIQQIQSDIGGSLEEAADTVFGSGGAQDRIQQLEQQVPGATQTAIQTANEIASQGPTNAPGVFGARGISEQIASRNLGTADIGADQNRLRQLAQSQGPQGAIQQIQGFQGDIRGAIQGAQNVERDIQTNMDDLIAANAEMSRFEEEQAREQLTDLLSSRGLAGGGAEIEAQNQLAAQFSRQRQLDSAKIQQDAQNQMIQQRLQSQQTIGQLAGTGASTGQAVGQLGLSGQQLQQSAAASSAQLGLQAQQQSIQQQQLQLAAAGQAGQLGLAEGQFLQGQQDQRLQAAGLGAQLGLAGIDAQGNLIGQDIAAAQNQAQLGLQGAGQNAALTNQLAQAGRQGAGEQAALAQTQAGLNTQLTQAQMDALLRQQQIDQGTQLQNFSNQATVNAQEQQLLNTALGQAQQSSIASGQAAAGAAAQNAQLAAQGAAGAGAAIGAGLNLAAANQKTGGVDPFVKPPGGALDGALSGVSGG